MSGFKKMLGLIAMVILACGISGCATNTGATSETSANPDLIKEKMPFLIRAVETAPVGETLSGMFTEQDGINPMDGSPYRVYELSLAHDQLLSILVTSSDISPRLALYTEQGELVGWTEYPASLIRRIPADGRYWLVVSHDRSHRSGGFDLTTELLEEVEVTVPGTAQGYLYEGTKRTHHLTGSPLRVFPFAVEETQIFTIVAESLDFDPELTIVEGESGQPVAMSTGYHDEPASVTVELLPGQYELWVGSGMNLLRDGSYRLTSEVVEFPRSEELVFGNRFYGFLGAEQERSEQGSLGQPIPFSLEEAATLEVVMRSQHFDSRLLLFKDGEILSQDSYSGGGTDARIVLPLEAGSYVLWATFNLGQLGKSFMGAFTIDAQLLETAAE